LAEQMYTKSLTGFRIKRLLSNKMEAFSTASIFILDEFRHLRPPRNQNLSKRQEIIKSLLFRQFIYVKLRTAVRRCKNLSFTCKNAQKPQKNTKFLCPLLDISMSGSPIIQGGKLVGAVTHVLVNDPTTGYGIFIENMLDAAA